MKEKRLHKPFPEIFKELARLAGKEGYEYEKADNSLEKIGNNIIISDVSNDYRMSICYNDENEIKELHYFAKNKTAVRCTMPIEFQSINPKNIQFENETRTTSQRDLQQ